MKKIIYLFILASFLFNSCLSTNSEEQEPTDLEQTEKVESTQPDSEQTEKVESTQPDLEQTEKVESTQPDSEQTESNPLQEEVPVLEPIEIEETPLLILEEKIPLEEISEDIEKLNSTNIDTVKVLEEEQILPETNITPIDTKNEPSKNQDTIINNANSEVKTNIEPVKTVTIQEQESDSKEENQNLQSKENDTSFDLQEDASLASEQINQMEIKEEVIPVPSRNIKIKNNQYLEINYPGTGWIYLGEYDKQNKFVFFGRKINNDNTTFTLKSRKSGTALLHFYKNDALSGKYIDDYIEVQIDNESATDSTPVVSPEYAKVVPPKPVKPVIQKDEEILEVLPEKEERKVEFIPEEKTQEKTSLQEEEFNIQTIIKNTDSEKDESSISKNSSAKNNQSNNLTDEKIADDNSIQTTDNSSIEYNSLDELFDKAKTAYNEKKFEEALSLIRIFLDKTSTRIDEGLFLEAQILESKSPVQNIKEAISDYDIIVSDWPQSELWNKAKKRSTYLKRFYIDIR